MKRLSKIMAVIMVVAVCCSLTACRQTKQTVKLATIVYNEYSENYERDFLMVLTPTVVDANLNIVGLDGAVLPEENGYINDSNESTTVKSGDLIIMEFEENLFIREETNPKVFIEGPNKVTVVARNIGVKNNGESFALTIPTSYFKGASISEKTSVSFYSSKQQTDDKLVYNKVIDSFTSDSVIISVETTKMQKVINSMAYGSFSAN